MLRVYNLNVPIKQKTERSFKFMKKTIAVLLAVFVMTMSVFAGLTFAAENEDLIGEWHIQSAIMDGVEMDASILSLMGMDMILTLNEDGSATMNMMSEVEEGTWTGAGTEGTLSFGEEDNELPFTVEDEKLTIEQDGQSMVFGKDTAQFSGVDLAPAVADAKAEDFNGVWNATTYVMFGIPLPIATYGVEITVTIEDGKAAVSEILKDMSNNFEVTDTLDLEFDTQFQEDGTLYIDFGGEAVLDEIGLEASGVYLTLHEDGRLSGHIPEAEEALASLAELSETVENTAAEEAEADPDTEAADAEAEGYSDGDSSGLTLEMYLILEKAE